MATIDYDPVGVSGKPTQRRSAAIAFCPAAFSIALCLIRCAADPPAAPAQASAPATLANALSAAAPPQGEIYLAVDAAKVKLPDGASAPAPGGYARDAAYAYGRLARPEGAVVAVAPSTMVVLNTDLGTPNPYAGMPPGDALQILFGSLNDAQWSALVNPKGNGFGYSDCADDDQRALWDSMFPAKPVRLSRGPSSSGSEPEFSDTLALSARLYLGRRVDVSVRDINNPGVGGGSTSWEGRGYQPPADADDSGSGPSRVRYMLFGTYSGDTDQIFGRQIRAILPNTLKPSDFDYAARSLRAVVDPSGVATVGALIRRIASAAGLELYAEPEYANLPVTLVGGGTVEAGDLLRALALCVCGAYRRLGPAYVLTDDLAGVGARRQAIVRFLQMADAMRSIALAKAGDAALTAHRGLLSAPFLDTRGQLSPAEQKSLDKQANDADGDNYYYPGEPQSLNLPYAQLTADQQGQVDAMIADSLKNPGQNDGTLTSTGDQLVAVEPQLVFTVPGIDGAIEAGTYFDSINNFLRASSQLHQAEQKQAGNAGKASIQAAQVAAAAPSPAAAAQLSAAALFAAEAKLPRRAVLTHPGSQAALASIVHSAKTAGFNELWIDAFSHGRPAVLSGGVDALAEAVRLCRGTGIHVVAAVDLLDWEKNTPGQDEDLTLSGQPLGPDSATARKMYSLMTNSPSNDPGALSAPVAADPSDYLSPKSPDAAQRLTQLIGALAATPGVAGIALRDTAPAGYDQADGPGGQPMNQVTLGFSPAMRLAYLRRAHIDPIDLTVDQSYARSSANTSLPYFESNIYTVDPDGVSWDKFRRSANEQLLTQAYSAARRMDGTRVPVLVQNRRSTNSGEDDWYGLWDGTTEHLPDLTDAVAGQGWVSGYASLSSAGQSSKTNLLLVQPWQFDTAAALAATLNQVRPGWSGVLVNDLDSSDPDPIAYLAASLHPDAPAGAKPSTTSR